MGEHTLHNIGIGYILVVFGYRYMKLKLWEMAYIEGLEGLEHRIFATNETEKIRGGNGDKIGRMRG